jgi:hypothetical protein
LRAVYQPLEVVPPAEHVQRKIAVTVIIGVEEPPLLLASGAAVPDEFRGHSSSNSSSWVCRSLKKIETRALAPVLEFAAARPPNRRGWL